MTLFLALLFIKHYVADFLLQTDEMVKEKGTYGAFGGLLHSAYHCILTFVIASFFTTPSYAIGLAVIDFIAHYHIDWLKMNYGNSDIANKWFWRYLGLDQLAHSLTYVLLVSSI